MLFSNPWNSTFFTSDDCWRLVHVNWALHSVSKDELDWMLVDDDGQVIKTPIKQTEAGPRVFYYDLDENYFLTDPQNFIYRYFLMHFNKCSFVWIFLLFSHFYFQFPVMYQLPVKNGNYLPGQLLTENLLKWHTSDQSSFFWA